MNDEFDAGPLSWVKKEIDSALARADEGIAAFGEKPENHEELKRTTLPYLHQVTGVLRMIGLESVVRVAAANESLVEALSRDDVPMNPTVIQAVRGAIKTLNQYLEGLIQGEPSRPLALFPAYRDVLAASGSGKASEVDLFYPDLTKSPTFTDGESLAAETEPAKVVKRKRTELQRALLGLLRSAEYQKNLKEMVSALAAIDTLSPAERRPFWWIAVGFLEGLADSPTPPDVFHKQLCGRVDLQIKRLLDAADTAPEGLIRELLLAVAYMRSASQRVGEIQKTYLLMNLLPLAEGPEATRLKLFVNNVKEQMEAAKEMWLGCAGGNQTSLDQFAQQTAQMNELARGFNNEPLQALFAKLAEIGSELNSNPRNPSETLVMETATTLLVTRDALNEYPQLDPNFDQLVKTVITQVSAALAGQPPSDNSTRLIDISWAAREKQLLVQLAQEILNNLNAIEQVLDGFFRDATKRPDLATLVKPVNQIRGALAMMECEDAVRLLKAGQTLVEKFTIGDAPPDSNDSELVAEVFSNLGVFVSALQQGREHPNHILRPTLARLSA
ncbi:MAG: hypothetical protein V4568_16055 [Pseudomonadota bacterium]